MGEPNTSIQLFMEKVMKQFLPQDHKMGIFFFVFIWFNKYLMLVVKFYKNRFLRTPNKNTYLIKCAYFFLFYSKVYLVLLSSLAFLRHPNYQPSICFFLGWKYNTCYTLWIWLTLIEERQTLNPNHRHVKCNVFCNQVILRINKCKIDFLMCLSVNGRRLRPS